MITVCDTCKNDGYFAVVKYWGESVGVLENGSEILGWDSWLETRYEALRYISPDLPEYGQLDPYDTEMLEVYARAILSDKGQELNKYKDRLVVCDQCETGRRIKEMEAKTNSEIATSTA